MFRSITPISKGNKQPIDRNGRTTFQGNEIKLRIKSIIVGLNLTK